MGMRRVAVKELEESNTRKGSVQRKFSRTTGQPRHMALPSIAPVGAVPISRRAGHGAPHCKESLMRHPPCSFLLATACADTFAAAVVPMIRPPGATRRRLAESAVAGPWDHGLQGSAPYSTPHLMHSSWRITVDFCRPVRHERTARRASSRPTRVPAQAHRPSERTPAVLRRLSNPRVPTVPPVDHRVGERSHQESGYVRIGGAGHGWVQEQRCAVVRSPATSRLGTGTPYAGRYCTQPRPDRRTAPPRPS